MPNKRKASELQQLLSDERANRNMFATNRRVHRRVSSNFSDDESGEFSEFSSIPYPPSLSSPVTTQLAGAIAILKDYHPPFPSHTDPIPLRTANSTEYAFARWWAIRAVEKVAAVRQPSAYNRELHRILREAMIAPPGPYRARTDQYQALFLRLLDQQTTPGYANRIIRVRRPAPYVSDTEYVSDDSD